MKDLVPIGRFSKVSRLTIPALRLYDELGLLRPAMVDPATGYRYYSLAQAADAERIRRLRAVEMPLDEILALRAERDPMLVRARLEAHRTVLLDRAAAATAALTALDRLIETGGHEMDHDVKVRETADQPMVSVRGHTPLQEMPGFFSRAVGAEFALLGRLGLRPAGPPFAIYHDPEFREEDIDIEVGIPVAEPVDGTAEVAGGTLPGGTVAFTLHCGPYDEIGAAYRAVFTWIAEHGHEMAGPPREVYLTDPGQVSDPAEYRTEVLWPIRS
jgi:effector-binding domain-containing protein/DNA-binding transcriptional MerR regulator